MIIIYDDNHDQINGHQLRDQVHSSCNTISKYHPNVHHQNHPNILHQNLHHEISIISISMIRSLAAPSEDLTA